ncbi:UNVERIFIED_CONTAM: hypothetical protein Slati_2232300 [Sesamum latifolium]|uniref:Uncharacterized protein n=1 Tax=Sesamum latifolium TaxID=2727402 RepID=A0AAW2WWE9_9LAMI
MKGASPETFLKGGPKGTLGNRAEPTDSPRKGVIRMIAGGPIRVTANVLEDHKYERPMR